MIDRTDPYWLCHQMEFDCPVVIDDAGNVTDVRGVYAPDVYDEDVHPDGIRSYVNPDGWEFLNGYSGQHGYSGPVMHPSEFIGGRMADDIVAEPGIYVAVVVECLTDEDYPDGVPDDVEIEPAGWAVLRKVA